MTRNAREFGGRLMTQETERWGDETPTAVSVRQRFAQLERRLRTLICLSGGSRAICVVIGGAMLYGVVDWLLHIDDPGLRLLAITVLTGGAGWIVWRWLWSPLRERRSHSALAALLEHHRPHLGNQLLSAAEFLEQGLDARNGSPLLQQAVINQADERLKAIDPQAIFDKRHVRRQTWAAVGMLVAALLLVFCFPVQSVTAMTRLFFPLSRVPWPRQVQLQLIDPDLTPWEHQGTSPRRVARGGLLELYVRNLKGELPRDVQLEYRIADGRLIREPLRKTILRDEEGRSIDVGGISLPATRGPIELRAVGGDDDLMDFFRLELVEPPALASLQLRLKPPAYSRRPEETLSLGQGDIEALVGTQVELIGASQQPLNEATLVFEGGGRESARLRSDGSSFEANFVLQDPQVTGYRCGMINRDGFSSGDRSPTFQIRLIVDQPPQMTLEEPATDVTATADAVLPLRGIAKDDLGLTGVRLAYQREGTEDVALLPLASYDRNPTEDRVVETWPLESLKLSPGARLQFRMEATDAFDLGPPHVGQSAPRTLTIVGETEKREELTERLAEMLSDISESAGVQQRIAEQTRELAAELQETSQLRPQDADLLRRLDLDQQRVLRQLLEPGESVRSRAERVLEEFEANHLSNDETTARLESLAGALTDLGQDDLPELQRRMTQAQKEAGESAGGSPQKLGHELQELQERQAAAAEVLSQLEKELSDWQDRRHVRQQLSDLIEAQRALNRDSRELTERELTAGADENSSSAQAGAEKLAQRQRAQADTVEQFRKQLEELSRTMAEKDAELSAQLEEMKSELEQADVAGHLRDAARDLTEGRPGQAVQQQAEGLRGLESLEDVLENRPPDEEEFLIKRLKLLETDLERLFQDQQELAGALNQAAASQDGEALERLAQQQEELRREAAKVEQQLQRLQLKRPQAALRRAEERMKQLTEDRQNPSELNQQLEETLADLEQARREVAQERRQAEENLAYEQLLQLTDELRGIVVRQQEVRNEVQRLEDLRLEKGSLSRGQLQTLRLTAATERDLAAIVEGLAERMSAAEAVSLALKQLGGGMQNVAGRLGEKQTDEPVQRKLKDIEDQLERLLGILGNAVNQAQGPAAEQQQDQPKQPQPSGPPGEVVTLIAQLEIAKGLQEDCLSRTAELQERRADPVELSEMELQELADLQTAQQRLADLMQNLLTRLMQDQNAAPAASKPAAEPVSPSREEQPESLPGAKP